MRSNEGKLVLIEEMREWGNEEKLKDRKSAKSAKSKKMMMSGIRGIAKMRENWKTEKAPKRQKRQGGKQKNVGIPPDKK